MDDQDKSRSELLRELEALRRIEQRYHDISDLTSDYAYSLRIAPDGSLENEWEDDGSAALPFGADTVVSRGWQDLIHPDDRPSVEERIAILRSGRSDTRDLRIVTDSGEIRWIRDSVRGVLDENNRLIRVYGSTKDVSELKEAQLAADAHRQELEARQLVLEAIPDLVLRLSRDLEVLYSSSASLAGRPLSLSSMTDSQLEPLLRRVIPEVIHDRSGQTFETTVELEGQAHPVELRVVPSGNDDVLLVLRDLSDRRLQEIEQQRIEAKVRHAQKLESLGVLAGGIAHDFNNILVGILGNSSLLLDQLSTETVAGALAREIEASAQRASELTDRLLAYAGLGRFVERPVDLNSVVSGSQSLLRTSVSSSVRLTLDLAVEVAPLLGDASQIEQVVVNLAINASESLSGDRGEVAVSTSCVIADPSDLEGAVGSARPTTRAPYTVLAVVDTGCGMSEEERSKMFDPFFTTKVEGRGLGMAVVLGIVRSHHAFIRVDSEAGKGTQVRVWFPSIDEPLQPAEDEDIAASEWTGNGRVLVVDDNEQVRRLAERMLSRLGFEVATSEDGRAAIERFSSDGAGFDCVLLDLSMPGMDGEQVSEALRSLDPHIPIIVSSGFGAAQVLERLALSGSVEILEKPYRLNDLRSKLRAVLG